MRILLGGGSWCVGGFRIQRGLGWLAVPHCFWKVFHRSHLFFHSFQLFVCRLLLFSIVFFGHSCVSIIFVFFIRWFCLIKTGFKTNAPGSMIYFGANPTTPKKMSEREFNFGANPIEGYYSPKVRVIWVSFFSSILTPAVFAFVESCMFDARCLMSCLMA